MSIELFKVKLEKLEEEKQNLVLWAACALSELPHERALPIYKVIENAQVQEVERLLGSQGVMPDKN